MSTQTSFVTPATSLRAYASTADLAIGPPASRTASDRARHAAASKDLRSEPGPIRFIIIALAVSFGSELSKIVPGRVSTEVMSAYDAAH